MSGKANSRKAQNHYKKWMKHVIFLGNSVQQLDANDAGFLQRVNTESIGIRNWSQQAIQAYSKFTVDPGIVRDMVQTLYGRNVLLKAIRFSITTDAYEWVISRYVNQQGADSYNISQNKAKIYVKVDRDGVFLVPTPTFYFLATDPNGQLNIHHDLRIYAYFDEVMMTGAITNASGERVQIGVDRLNRAY